jgi:6-pyruvoyltetrahydropterin/6-carboxytetrahydropterin synthase
MHSVGSAVEFTAQHIMHGLDGPEGELHEHDYRVEVVIERETLDDRGMVCDIDVLNAVLQGIDDTLRGKNVDVIRPAGTESVTVEVFAKWAFEEFARALGTEAGRTIAVRVWESALAFGGYSDR